MHAISEQLNFWKIQKPPGTNQRNDMSATMRVLCSIKQKYRDVILFFKVGKFYEVSSNFPAGPACSTIHMNTTEMLVLYCKAL